MSVSGMRRSMSLRVISRNERGVRNDEQRAKTIEVTIERTIPAPPSEVFDAWLNPKIPGNPWNMAENLLFNPKVDGFFYWAVHLQCPLGAGQVSLQMVSTAIEGISGE
jgi:hypothetical protein